MKGSEFDEVKTDTKNVVHKVRLNFEDMIFQGRKFQLSFFPWIRTHELKTRLIQ